MPPAYDQVVRLTEPTLPPAQRRVVLKEFARLTGWRPSYELEYPELDPLANAHLVVEHGLDNAAVISFLKEGKGFSDLGSEDRLRLLGVSYNNLVDWHFFPRRDRLTFVYNRTDPPHENTVYISEHPDAWRVEAFNQVIGRRLNPNVKSLDQALIDTIAYWKKSVAAELRGKIELSDISLLFNSILFVRALEDDRKNRGQRPAQNLLELWVAPAHPQSLRAAIETQLRALGHSNVPNGFIDLNRLNTFNALDRDTVQYLISDFYNIKTTPYKYDFSVMSKHALSKIYEQYVSLLRQKDSPQQTLFPGINDLPAADSNRSFGSYYTPQFIARFFARYLQENLPPRTFRSLTTCDPACGSGIFLRTLLELQCDPLQEVGDFRQIIEPAFRGILGIDIDENAAQATSLSLNLLYLVLTGDFPPDLKVEVAESILYCTKHPELKSSFDVVIANPPYLKWDSLREQLRKRISSFMGTHRVGKPDMFLAQLKLGMELVKPGGFLLYVVPHSFMLAENASKVRHTITSDFWVRFVADLSRIPVFENVGAYVVLLVIQKKSQAIQEEPLATIVRCVDFPGKALQDALDGKRLSTDYYQIYDQSQAAFNGVGWKFVPPSESGLKSKLSRFPSLDKFLTIREGFVTGADDVFVLDNKHVPAGESTVWIPVLHDREMKPYSVPSKTKRAVFYPYLNGDKLDGDQVRSLFPLTWRHLRSHMKKLNDRSAVRRGQLKWWCPERPRSPENMLRTKLVSPHLVLRPRFSLDERGSFAVSHCPLMYPTEPGDDVFVLRYYLAVLNSSVGYWQIAHLSDRYSRGYAMLEKKTLSQLRVPDSAAVPQSRMQKIQNLVKTLITDNDNVAAEAELDAIVAELYSLSRDDRQEIGME